MTRKTSSPSKLFDSQPLFPEPEPEPVVEKANGALGFDDVRRSWTGIGIALYALEAGGPVTLEIHSEGEVYTFAAATAEEAFQLAFPPLDDVFA